MPHSGTVLKIFQKVLFEEMAKICHAIMCRGIPTFDKTSAQQRLCCHEESQGARSGEYGDCHTVDSSEDFSKNLI
jgi:hypothetical protein